MTLEAIAYQPPQPRTFGKIAGALAKAQGVMTGAKKDATNSHFRNSYATLEAVIEAVREPLSSNGIAFFQWFETDGTKVTNYTMLIHSESGEYLESGPASAESKGKGPQEIGSTVTYLRRYQLMAMAGIAPEDDDGEAAHGRQPEQAQARPQAQQGAKPTAQASKPAATVKEQEPKAPKPPKSDEEVEQLMDATLAEIRRSNCPQELFEDWASSKGYPTIRAKMSAEQLRDALAYLSTLPTATKTA
jgi:hypothetical protein